MDGFMVSIADQYRVMVSWRFRTTRQTLVQAAASAWLGDVGRRGGEADLEELLRVVGAVAGSLAALWRGRRGATCVSLRLGRAGRGPLIEASIRSRRSPPASRGSSRPGRGRPRRTWGRSAGSGPAAGCWRWSEPRCIPRARGVEVGQHRVQEGALPVHVDAAAVLAVVAVGDVVAVGELEVRVIAGGLIGVGARAADRPG